MDCTWGRLTLEPMAEVQIPTQMVLRTTAGLCGPGFLGSLPNSERSFSDSSEDNLLQNIRSSENSSVAVYHVTNRPVTDTLTSWYS